MLYARRLNLENAINLRELGGFMRADRKITKYGQFLRSGSTSGFNVDELEFLRDYGLKTVIDLRVVKEITQEPSSFTNVAGINYFHISMMDLPSKDNSLFHSNEKEFSLGTLYELIFEHSKSFGDIFNTMAENSNGAVLFNCTAGKDRTGLVSALLLMIAGIDEIDIIADYQVSFTYFKKAYNRQLEINPNMPMHFAYSNPEWIENFMRLIRDNYSNAENFLTARGVKAESIEILRNKLI